MPGNAHAAPRCSRVTAAAIVACVALFGAAPLLAGTCATPGAHLTKEEYRNVKAACELVAAEMAGWKNAAEGRRRLSAIQAENFEYYYPTSEALRFKRETREDFVKYVTELEHGSVVPGSYLKILATTAQGNRVATEMVSDIRRKDGSAYKSVYHQLFEFDDAGKIRVYKIYMDSAALARDARAQQRAVVMRFFDGITATPPADFGNLFSEQIRWIAERPGAAHTEMNHEAVLKTIAGLPSAFRQLKVTPDMDGITQQDDRVAVEAKSHGIFASGAEYNNIYHFLFVIDGDKIKEIREYSPSNISPEAAAQ